METMRTGDEECNRLLVTGQSNCNVCNRTACNFRIFEVKYSIENKLFIPSFRIIIKKKPFPSKVHVFNWFLVRVSEHTRHSFIKKQTKSIKLTTVIRPGKRAVS